MPQPLINLIQPDIDAVVALYEPAGQQTAAATAIEQPPIIAQFTLPPTPQPPAPSP
jgi:hypothetical protein